MIAAIVISEWEKTNRTEERLGKIEFVLFRMLIRNEYMMHLKKNVSRQRFDGLNVQVLSYSKAKDVSIVHCQLSQLHASFRFVTSQ